MTIDSNDSPPVESGARSPLRLKRAEALGPSAPRPSAVPLSAKASAPARSAGRDGPLWVFYSRWLAWGLFLLIGAVMGTLRYGPWLTVQDVMVAHSLPFIIGMHGIVFLIALRDDFFMGVLCLLIPGFTLYYLLIRSERIFLAAILCGLLVGFAESGWEALEERGRHYYEEIDRALGR